MKSDKRELLLNQFVSPLQRSAEEDEDELHYLAAMTSSWARIAFDREKNIMIPPGSTDLCLHTDTVLYMQYLHWHTHKDLYKILI